MTKTRRIKAPSKSKGDLCFVIMPFGGWFDDYYNEIYCTAITKAGMVPRRADDLYRPSNIVQDIWGYTKKAKIILADLTTKNPNVFYELGLAHAIAKPVVLITENIDDVPFDLRNLRIIPYDKNKPNWGDDLMMKIESAIKETIESPNETIPTAFLETVKLPKNKVTNEQKDLIGLKQEIEGLKREVYGRNYNLDTIERDKNNEINQQGNFMTPLAPSPALAKIIGTDSAPRTEIVRKIWNYVKKNNLQDKKNRRMINVDATMRLICGNKKQISMFELAKIVSKHVS